MSTASTPAAVRFSPAELADRAEAYRAAWRRGWAPPPDMPLSFWAEQNVVLPRAVTAFPGPLSFARTPYVRAILDAFADPEVERVTWVSSTQVGKTTVELACLAATAGYDPGPALAVQPDEDMARSFAMARALPVFRESPGLARLLPKGRGVTTREMILSSAVINFASARSSASLASRAKRYLIFGETDEYPPDAGKGGSPIAQAEERTRTYWDRKIYESSTPKHQLGYIWRSWLRSRQHHWFVPCPHCGEFQVLTFDGRLPLRVAGPAGRIGWPRDERGHPAYPPDDIQKNLLAWYECGACHAVWEDGAKEAVIARGEWRAANPERSRRHVGFHSWAAVSPWLSWSEIAAKFLREQDYPELVQVFVNKWLGQPHEDRGEKPKVETVLARRKTYLLGTVPEGVRFLTGGIDVHSADQYWMIWGWGMGFTGWLVAVGVEKTLADPAAGWERIFQTMTREYPAHPPGAGACRIGLPTGQVLMDCGWDRPDDPDENVDQWEVLQRCDQWNQRVQGPMFQPSKGASSPNADYLRFSRTVDRDREGKPLDGRLQMHLFNPFFFKKSFYLRMQTAGEVGGFWLPADLPRAVMDQMFAEEMVVHPDGREEWVKRGANHWMDTAVLCLAAAWKYRLYLESPPPASAPRGPAPDRPPDRPPSGSPIRLPERRLT